jgi:hypothetical protein
MGRAVIVGDLHGCADELERLLDHVRFGGGDALYLLGDLLSRGPDPKRVLAIMTQTGARGVRGNHDDALVEWRAAIRERGLTVEEVLAKGGDAPASIRLGKSNRKLVEILDDADMDRLEGLPLWLDLPNHKVRLVHGGVIPGVEIDAQPKKALLSMRYLGPKGEPIEKGGTVLWGTRYEGPPHVVFGHNAQPEPQLHRWATGIDTGAVYGNRLTALVLDETEPVPPVDERPRCLFSVAARARYDQA